MKKNKLIRSQDGQQLHYMPISTPCYFNISADYADEGDSGHSKIAFCSVGINGVSFGIYKSEVKAAIVLEKLEKFLLGSTTHFAFPKDT